MHYVLIKIDHKLPFISTDEGRKDRQIQSAQTNLIILRLVGEGREGVRVVSQTRHRLWRYEIFRMLVIWKNYPNVTPIRKCHELSLRTATFTRAVPRSAVGSTSDSRPICPGFDTRSSHILLFFLSLIQEGQLLVDGESICTRYWLTA